jgi:alpha-ribazole phosphatase/probable phosphoglycerate mutase
MHDAHTLAHLHQTKNPGGMMTTTIDLLRHGALEGGIRYRGNTEAALTQEGRAAMDAVWRKLDGSIDAIVTSPMSRCRQPAEAWAKEAGISCRVEPNIREMDYGAWEGLSKEEIETRFPGMLSRWRENPVGMQILGAERIEDFAGRVIEGWKVIVDESSGKHVLVVAHSGSLRVILAHVLGAPLPTIRRFAMPYASWNRVIDDHGKLCLEYLNRRI